MAIMTEDVMNVDVTSAETEQAILDNKKINEEYKTWKKHAAILYDLMYCESLAWPTLTTQWLPDKQSADGYDTHRLIFGTHTNEEAPNYLQIAHLKIPHMNAPSPSDYDEERGEIGGFGASKKDRKAMSLEIVQKIDHEGEVNKARYMPQNPEIIATMCNDGKTAIFDRTKHPLQPTGNVNPQIELVGHTKEGYGLNWSALNEGQLATGSEDKTVRLWDIKNFSKSDKKLRATRTFTHHSAVVNDVEFHPAIPFVLASVSDDLTLQVLDTRESSNNTAARKCNDAHTDAINAVAFNPGSEYILATGSADTSIGIWDLRNLKVKLTALEHHTDIISRIEWHPTLKNVLASAANDRRLLYWDLSKCGNEQTPEDAEDGPPELMFMHGGHTNHISDFNFNKNDPWLMCSAAEDNLVMMWKPSSVFVGEGKGDVPYDELEQ